MSSPLFVTPRSSGSGSASSAAARFEVIEIKDEDDENNPRAIDIQDTPIPELDAQQQCAHENIVHRRRNAFITGIAGSGKSSLARVTIRDLRNLGLHVYVTSFTGIAANNIGGMTIFSYAGWTVTAMKKGIRTLEGFARGGHAEIRLRSTDVLIIDEISMVEKICLERLNRVMQAAKRNDLPFGGAQVIIFGDFCQLPPVKPFSTCFNCGRETKKKWKQYECPIHGIEKDQEKWAFSAQVWEDANFFNVRLQQNHRQSEPVLQRIIDKYGKGQAITQTERDLLYYHPNDAHDGVKIMPLVEAVKDHNNKEFDRLAGRAKVYHCLDFFKWNEEHEHLERRGERKPDGTLKSFKDHTFEPELRLKVGMPVILLTNMDVENGLVNGSQGKIIRFEEYDAAKLPAAKAGLDYSEYSGYDADDRPQRLASTTVASRGGDCALLRQEQQREFMEQDKNRDKVWPVVKFTNGKEVAIFASCRVAELGDDEPYTLEARTQIPLAPAWALTIHKAQGMTLDKVIVDLTGAFEEGQAYVALSRARTLRGLKVISLGRNSTGANPQAQEFLENTRWDVGGI